MVLWFGPFGGNNIYGTDTFDNEEQFNFYSSRGGSPFNWIFHMDKETIKY